MIKHMYNPNKGRIHYIDEYGRETYTYINSVSNVPSRYGYTFLDTIEEDEGIKLDERQKGIVSHLEYMYGEDAKRRSRQKFDQKALLLFVGGSMGLGKTMLACSYINYVNGFRAYCESEIAVYATLSKIAQEAMADGKKSEGDTIWFYSRQRVVVIDEILSTSTPYELKLLEQIVYERHAKSLPLILISNMFISQLKGLLAPHIIDRIENEGTIALMRGESYRGK